MLLLVWPCQGRTSGKGEDVSPWNAASSKNHPVYSISFISCLCSPFSLPFFSFCWTPLSFWNVLRRDWFTCIAHCKWGLLCWALYQYCFQPKELVTWLRWAQDSAECKKTETVNTEQRCVAVRGLPQASLVAWWDLLRTWAPWRSGMRWEKGAGGEKGEWKEAGPWWRELSHKMRFQGGWGAQERCAMALEFRPSEAVPALMACAEALKAHDVLCSGRSLHEDFHVKMRKSGPLSLCLLHFKNS